MSAAHTPVAKNTIVAKIAAVRTRYQAARKQLGDSEAEEIQRLQQECADAGHQWKWHQVAGNGRYCQICDINDASDD